MANNAKIVTLIDSSGSMKSSGYLEPAKSDADTFINMFQPNDEFAVISFETTIHRTYPTSATLAVYSSPQVMEEASAAIQAIRSGNTTNIGDALIAANNLLQPKQEPRGTVLLSDGYWNVGPDPLDVLDKDIRTYTIALGNNGQLDLLRQIANETQGQYFFSPDEIGLASIYFDILEYGQVGQIVNNAFKTVDNGGSLRVPVKLSDGLDSASVGVNWADPSIPFDPTGTGEGVSVRILDPNFKVAHPPITDRDYGFVVYTLDQPIGGTWQFDCFYRGSNVANITVGALDPDLVLALELDAPRHTLAAGHPVAIPARVTFEGEPLEDVKLQATVEAPAVSTAEALARHAVELETIELDDDVAPNPFARLTALRRQKLPYVDIMPRYTARAKVDRRSATQRVVEVATDKPGEYTLRVQAQGRHPRGGEFMRTKHVTLTVR